MAKLFKTVVNLVELTKLLKRENCDTLITNKYLGNKVYADKAKIIMPKVTENGAWNTGWKIQ